MQRPATLDDVELLAALVNNARAPFAGRDVMLPEDMRSILTLPTVDLSRDARVLLDPDGSPVGSVMVVANQPWTTARVYLAVPEDQQRAETIGAGVDLAFELARSRHELGPGTVVDFEIIPEDDVVLRDALRAQGVSMVRSDCEMVRDLRDLEDASWPSDIELSVLDVADDASLRVVGEMHRVAYGDHDGDYAMPVEDFVHLVRTTSSLLPQWSVVAWRSGAPVGLCLNGEEADRRGGRFGYVGSLTVAAPHRGQGLGRALLLRSFQLLAEAGYVDAMLHVQRGNRTGADRLYRSVGMTPGAVSETWSTTLPQA